MSISEMFQEFLDNLKIDNDERISERYGEITKSLNKKFRNTTSTTDNSLQVGSFGRGTGIKGISDLDMLYIMPNSKWVEYNKNGGQAKLLRDAKEGLLERYPLTDIHVDRLVVTVRFTNFYMEVQPVFEIDGNFTYPDTKGDGSWKITKPREEISEIRKADNEKNRNLRRLCKMVRAWKNQHGVSMGGLLIDTLVYNFFQSTNEYDERSFLYYAWLSRDFFKYLSELPEQSKYRVFGSNQDVKVKGKFQSKAKKAYDLASEAIRAEGNKTNAKWREIYGRSFPASAQREISQENLAVSLRKEWVDTEQFIEKMFLVDIRENLKIDCEIKQKGQRKFWLSEILGSSIKLKANKALLFKVINISVQEPYHIYWKVLNRGEEAKRRNCIRGQIEKDKGLKQKSEHTDFQGDHIVECYCVKNGVVVAKDRIHVPIIADGSDYA